MNLWLDDLRGVPGGPEWATYFHAKTAPAAIMALETQEFGMVSLDHDLGLVGDPGEGYDVLIWIEYMVRTKGWNPPEMRVHSANPVARDRMERAIHSILTAIEVML